MTIVETPVVVNEMAIGTQGPQGVSGANWKGAYDSGTAYVVGDIVREGTYLYICKEPVELKPLSINPSVDHRLEDEGVIGAWRKAKCQFHDFSLGLQATRARVGQSSKEYAVCESSMLLGLLLTLRRA